MRRRKHYLLPVAAGFMAVYLVIMSAVTWLVHEKFMDEFEMRYNACIENARQRYGSMYTNYTYNGKREDESLIHRSVARWVWDISLDTSYLKKYQQFSFAFYDQITQEIYAMEETFSIGTNWGYKDDALIAEPLGEYMTNREIESLASYVKKVYNSRKDIDLETYECYTKMNRESHELCGFMIQKIVWEKNGENPAVRNPITGTKTWETITSDDGQEDTYLPIAYQIVWEWDNPKTTAPEEAYMIEYSPDLSFYLPYVRSDIDVWKRWRNSTYMQEIVQSLDIDTFEEMMDSTGGTSGRFAPQCWRMAKVMINMDTDFGYLFIASESHPWLAAFDYMKWAYLACLLFMFVCIAVVVSRLDRTDKKRTAIEENRRNFTHALASKMEQPLLTIRELKVNLQEEVAHGQQDVYLKQMIHETEVMDRLVGEMIDMSKLDSEQLVFQKDHLSVGDIIREQLVKLEDLMTERELAIKIEETAAFYVTGDKKYLSRAIDNLLDNAVRYSDVGGTIHIVITSYQCSIENPCPSAECQQGAGLYLAGRIFELCHLTMTVESTDNGVQATIR